MRSARQTSLFARSAKLIRSTEGAHNALLDLKKLDERQLDETRAFPMCPGRARSDRRLQAAPGVGS